VQTGFKEFLSSSGSNKKPTKGAKRSLYKPPAGQYLVGGAIFFWPRIASI